MSEPVKLPANIIQAIEVIKATPVDPSDFSSAVQELYNRGFGVMGKWIQENKDLYLKALQNGYVPEGTVSKSETKAVKEVVAEVKMEEVSDSPPAISEEKEGESEDDPFTRRHKRG